MSTAAQKQPYAHSISDAAELSGVSVRTLYDEIALGRLKTIKIGRRRLVLDGALRDWLEAHQTA